MEIYGVATLYIASLIHLMEDPLMALAFSFRRYLRHCLLCLMRVRSTTAVVSHPLFPVMKQDVHLFFCGGAFFKRSSVVFVFSSHRLKGRLTHSLVGSPQTPRLKGTQLRFIRLSSVHFTSSPFRVFSAHLTWKVAISRNHSWFWRYKLLNQDRFVTCTVVAASDVIRLIVIIRNRCQNPCCSLLTQS